MKSTVIILAMHGAPPNDYPPEDLREYFQLHGALEASSHNGNGKNWPIAERFAHIDAKMRAWPRTEANDPFYAGSVALAEDLEKKAGDPVLLAFNEFCGPSLEQAFERAARPKEQPG